MRVIKPAWVEHTGGEKKKKCPVYSLSVHPDGTRLATGGLDRKIKIWSTLPILDPDADKAEENHKLLCTMSEHTGSVLAVRWAHHGRFLASGSDDQVAMIWGLDPDGGGRLWGSDEVNVENWKPLTRLVGHVADIIDMAWSRDDTMLASVGLDSTVWIWDGQTFERLRKLDKHQGFVKGVCWDPVGNYLATQSDDKTVKIWNADTWELVSSVSEPFANSGHATFFRRLSWSPDGAFIAASNAKNGPVFVAAVIDREGWTSEISFVGHVNTIQVAAFNPRLFFNQNEAAARSTASCMLALGADDFSISIWRNTLHTPIVVLHNIFEHSLLDLCWSNDGHHLYGSSEDGTICAISFDDNEVADLGTPEMTEKVLEEYNYKPSRRIARPIPSAPPQIATGFGTSTTSSTAVNVLQARKARPGDQRRRVDRTRPTPATAGPSRAPPLGAPALPDHSVFDGPIQDGFISPSQAQASTQRMFRDADTAFGGNMSPTKAGKRKASMAFEEGPRGRMMATTTSRNIEVREIRPPRVSIQSGLASSSSSIPHKILPVPTIQTLLRSTSGSIYLEARNGSTAGERNQVVYNKDGMDVWVDFVQSAVVVLAVGEKCAAIGCEDGTVYVYSTAGRHLSSMKLPSTPVDLSIAGYTLAILTADTEVRLISSKTGRLIGLSVSCSHLLEPSSPDVPKNIDITRFAAYTNGSCSIITPESAAFILDPALSAWTPLSTPPSSLPSLKRLQETSPRGPLYTIHSDLLASSSGRQADRGREDNPEWYAEATTLRYLESNLKAAEILGSGEEWAYWVEKYVEVLAKEGFEGKAEEICAELMGPVYRRDDIGSRWKESVGGIKKREIINRVLGILGQRGDMGELVSRYRAILRMVAASDEDV